MTNRDDPWLTCGERDDRILSGDGLCDFLATLGILEPEDIVTIAEEMQGKFIILRVKA